MTRSNFIKNVVLDNILPGDIYAKARELHFATDVSRVVLLIRVTSGATSPLTTWCPACSRTSRRTLCSTSAKTTPCWSRRSSAASTARDLEKLASSIVDTLNGEHYIKAVVGIGTPIANVKDLATSF